jgi:4-carboxymuconolactone decarboxylase
MSESADRDKAIKLFQSWSSAAMQEISADSSPNFCMEMTDIAMDNVFARLWVRPGLDLRARSLLTLGILIALRAYEELEVHFPIALKNGCTIEEIEEVIYHSTAYAGFPAANLARRAAVRTLRKEGKID